MTATLARTYSTSEELALKPAEIAEFLHALALHFGGVDVALAVDADEVEVVELAELMADAAERPHQPAVGAIDHVELAVGVVDHQEIGLRRIRPLYDRADGAGRTLLEHRDFAHEGPVLAEHLHAVVAAVAHQHQPVIGHGDAMHGIAELLGRRTLRVPVDLRVV